MALKIPVEGLSCYLRNVRMTIHQFKVSLTIQNEALLGILRPRSYSTDLTCGRIFHFCFRVLITCLLITERFCKEVSHLFRVGRSHF